LVRTLKRSYRIPRHLYFHVLGNTKLDSVPFEACNGTVNPACRDDLIAHFEVFDHLLNLLLTAAVRQDHDQVENDDYYKDWPEAKDVRLLGRLQKQTNFSLFLIPDLSQKLIKAAKLDKLPYSLHGVKVEVNVMDSIQDRSQNLVCHEQMT